ncbi:MAG: hypothetical protein EA342_10105 [Leptolyngbya sp. LCM1.Bin17]|nr:MAG: hypothetical protein EA342_10105 [Leptolyngbya sp. LCM1.Bin17]
MKVLKPFLTLSTTAMLVMGGAALAQPVAQTPLDQPVQTSGSVTPTQASSCGFLANDPTQILQVTQDFASVHVNATGDSGLTLLIEGPGGFSECHTTSDNNGAIRAPGLLNQGSYSFFIGNANQTTTNYTLTISED